MKPERAYRLLFAFAAGYNVAFGLWASLRPMAFFEAFRLAAPNYPSIWGCLGMVVGLYGPLYAYVAWKPERGDAIVAVGLAGKILGPLGWLAAVANGELPPRTFPLILMNDLVWWFPFAFYLLRHVAARRAIIGGFTVAIHFAACVALLAVRQGTEANPNFESRAAWLSQHRTAWVIAWFLWTISSLSLLAFCVAWAGQLRTMGIARRGLLLGCLIVALGLMFDLAGETLQIAVATGTRVTPERLVNIVWAYNLLGPGAANGLYCVGGLLLSAAAWRSGFLRGGVGMLGFAVWGVGILLTLFAVADHRLGMLLAGGGVMLLFLPWAAAVSWRLKVAGTP
jgi:hypothetical protein